MEELWSNSLGIVLIVEPKCRRWSLWHLQNHQVKQIAMKFKEIFSTDLVKVSLLNGVSTLIRMIAGLVSTKVVASIIGPTGIALIGQLNNFVTIILSLANGGITTGVTTYVAEHANHKENSQAFISNAFRISLISSSVIAVAIIFSADYLSHLILHSSEYKFVFRIFGGTIFLYALHALVLAILNGYKEYRKYVRVNIYSSIVSLVFSVILAVTLGLKGALISVVTYQSVVFLITLTMVYNSSWFSKDIFKSVVNLKIVRQLLHFSLMAFTSALIIPLSQLLVRSHIASTLSVDQAGIWEGINRISGMYVQVVVASLSVYYLPRLAGLKNNNDVRREVFAVYKLMLPFLAIASLVIYLLRDLIITIVFTGEFTAMRDLFLYQLMGDFLKMSGWVLGFIMIARAMTRTFIIMELLNYGLFILLSYFLIPQFGLVGSAMAYVVGHGVYLICMLVIFRKFLDVRSVPHPPH